MVLFLLLHLLLGVDPLHLLLLTLDMTDGVSLRVVETGWSEEQSWQGKSSLQIWSLNKTLPVPCTTGGSGVVEVEGDIIKYKMVLGERYRNFNGKISMIRIFNLLASSLSVSSQLFKSCYKFYSPRKNARMMTD